MGSRLGLRSPGFRCFCANTPGERPCSRVRPCASVRLCSGVRPGNRFPRKPSRARRSDGLRPAVDHDNSLELGEHGNGGEAEGG